MTTYYPVYLNIQDRRCVIIGGGAIGEQKTRYLLECGATITVVAPAVTEWVKQLAEQGYLTWLRRNYQDGDLRNSFLAICGTDDSSVNEQVSREAEREKVLLNAVDDPRLCNFIAPAIVQRGQITVAISTGGVSPALARRLRTDLENSDVLSWADAAEVLQKARLALRRSKMTVSPEHWQACLTNDLLTLIQSGNTAAAHAHLMRALEEGATGADKGAL